MATPSRDYPVGSPVPRARLGAARPTRRPPPAPPGPPVNWLVVGAAGSLALAAVVALVVFCTAPHRTPRPVAVAPPAEEIVVAAAPEPAPPPVPLAEPPAAPGPGTLKSAGSAPPTDVRPGPGAAGFAKGYGALEPVRFRRRDLLSTDELSRQLLAAPEVSLDGEAGTSARIPDAARLGNSKFVHPVLEPLLKRADLHGLPVAMGTDCQLGKESAENLQALSRKLRLYLSQSVPPGGLDPRVDAAALRPRLLAGPDWQGEDAVPTLVQLLQAEDRPVRLLLVRLLAAIKGRAASAALAGRAVFDLSAEVREAAVGALAERPRDEYRGQLLDGLRYPWPPAADHAAEALVALDDRDALPRLTELLAEPDPAAPRPQAYGPLDPALLRAAPRAKYQLALSVVALEERPGEGRRTTVLSNPEDVSDDVKASARKVWAVREVVRVNHLRNCLLCHAAATTATDPVRGLVPTPGQPLPPPTTPYYGGQNGLFVRADVTYLRQDFSVPQPVPDAGVWPAHQRYDYVVRTRYPTAEELRRKAPATYPQREAVRWALRELGAKDG